MIGELLKRDDHGKVVYIETTVTPSNTASDALFNGYCKEAKYIIKKDDLYTEDLFVNDGHETEVLYRIGPFKK
jgi:L-2,4-diaminobutyric acid acetyltransferase